MGCVSTKSSTETKSPPKIPEKDRNEEVMGKAFNCLEISYNERKEGGQDEG